MNNSETGKDKIRKICDILKEETLEPAKEEAQKIITDAHEEAQKIIEEAKQKADAIVEAGKKRMEREHLSFENSIAQACKQSMEYLRQQIETQLFNAELPQLINQEASNPKVIAQLITVLVDAVQKEGISADFSAIIPQNISPETVNSLLAKNILQKLKEKSVEIGPFKGGAQLKLINRQVTLDLSDQALFELMEKFLHKDFRALLFKK